MDFSKAWKSKEKNVTDILTVRKALPLKFKLVTLDLNKLKSFCMWQYNKIVDFLANRDQNYLISCEFHSI